MTPRLSLSPGQAAVARCLADGMSYQQAGAYLGLAYGALMSRVHLAAAKWPRTDRRPQKAKLVSWAKAHPIPKGPTP